MVPLSELVLLAEIFLMLLGVFIALFFLLSMLSFLFGAPFVSSGREEIRAALKLARLKKDEKFYDLGSGDGRVVFAAASLGAKAVGVEINPVLWLWSSLIAFVSRRRAKFVLGNFFNVNLRDADVVFLYTWQGTNERIEGKLRKELKKGARVVSHCFKFANWKPSALDDERRLLLYVKK